MRLRWLPWWTGADGRWIRQGYGYGRGGLFEFVAIGPLELRWRATW